ncbi:hypothetical protein BFU36_11460 [Sulfolobus sp. A20]|uniref:hypothetical protein n=1 Tax=Sulfolobaceae TaxID=118883 RepID=UPI000845E693|nr:MULTISPECIES: hypothetical protein [unclassified Sulfolobus]TRM77128.1 hypothetical protein DJ528_07300 [Sulfolobus sp. B5]TRM80097.1 hypothetical protein DJ524_08675 [Sulfolobus sp. D5]TRM87173.1 hypothetical protein DJ529_09280 [Sulfolobus sp. C3]TRM87303.1 hypothetical protein DJ521_03825 [Sulfolobus sp. E3]TRN03012.1 hypothetical protein DJ527_02870 [Sulfolobus sp. F1]TRN04817.1 hypothetical protein DJ530_00295 [Sulfolobus sp. E1]
MLNKGLSNVVATIIIILVFLTVFIPFLYTYFDVQQLGNEYQLMGENGLYYKNIETTDLETGKIQVSYYVFPQEGNTYLAEITFTMDSQIVLGQLNYLEIAGIYNYTGSQWQLISYINGKLVNYPLQLPIGYASTLTFYEASPSPVVIQTYYGNLLFLTPNSTGY